MEPAGAVRMGAGYFDLDGSDSSVAIEGTYRLDRWQIWRARPQIGVMLNTDQAVYGYFGYAATFRLPRQFRVSGSFGAGAYRQGNSVDLGSALEFRSAIQLERLVRGNDWIGVSFYHLSNAGVANRNPGTEVLSLVYIFHW